MADSLGTFEQAVLLAIIRLGEHAYGRAIHGETQDRMKRNLVPGAVHATLDRLENKQLLSSRVEPGTPARSGRARRYYWLTPPGVKALNESRATIDALWRGLQWPLKGSLGGQRI